MGRGQYYKNKYGRGRSNASTAARDESRSGAAERSRSRERPSQGSARSWDDLGAALTDLEGRTYGAYNTLRGSAYQCMAPVFMLHVDSIQGDAYASPSRFHVVLHPSAAKLPPEMVSTTDRRVSAADFLARRFVQAARQCGADVRVGGQGWHGVKGGDLSMAVPSQHVLERTNVLVHDDGCVEARFTVGLPARGRSICGGMAKKVLVDVLPSLVARSLLFPAEASTAAAMWAHVRSVEDQIALRQMLNANNLVGFIANGAVLPRESGDVDTPLAAPPACPFEAPASSPHVHTFTLPHRGQTTGLGLPKGITLLVGGGYHGKSTVLRALQVGMYNHIPGDGREFVVVDAGAVTIRAEDGRPVTCSNLSPFISNLPFGQSTTEFTTTNASGSTSQAANIVEALEVGATTLLMDEDTCATNFMIRDRKMQLLVARHKEPITPFIGKARALFAERGVSSVLVIGGAGDYFSIADAVFMMDTFQPHDVTDRAKAIAAEHPAVDIDASFVGAPLGRRVPSDHGFYTDGKVRSNGLDSIQYGDVDIHMGAVHQLVEATQLRAISRVLSGNLVREMDGRRSIPELLDLVEQTLDQSGLDAIAGDKSCGLYARPRRFEIAAALNRVRSATFHRATTSE
ncbi:Aste57867_9184 [Aphanomyces stellatus]|uniref:Aste57867_9184 protein n=1 Tax=Aphanomyces stellatus TaxID=120398 RepID=A0A485KMD2_9STRA|nr:hypothetical protein As57867_009148 [Aphanomyces stellatus]VFT86067.1 Aste57867_9184 [Aphanomyces stellatus]